MPDSGWTREDGFKHRREGDGGLKVVIPPRRNAGAILFFGFGVIFTLAIAGAPFVLGGSISWWGKGIFLAFGILVGGVCAHALVSELVAGAEIEVVGGAIRVRRPGLIQERVDEFNAAAGAGWRLGAMEPIQRTYSPGDAIEYANTGIEVYDHERAVRLARQLQGAEARKLVQLLQDATATAVNSGDPGKVEEALPYGIRWHHSPDAIRLDMRATGARWFACIPAGGVGVGFVWCAAVTVMSVVRNPGSVTAWIWAVMGVGAGVAVLVVAVWFIWDTIFGRESITVTEHGVIIERRGMLGRKGAEVPRCDIREIAFVAMPDEGAAGAKREALASFLLGPVVIDTAAGRIRLGSLAFESHAPLIVRLIGDRFPDLAPRSRSAALIDS